ncbi:transposase [Fibrella sp. WM1]|uniref:transposase n=1 Tax=Fibrella musci TaxID=3242485 RepID=UPI0035228DDC
MEQRASRRSIRLKEYDYASDGAYFVTICTQHKEDRFGYIAHDEMVLNEAGRMIEGRILAIPSQFPGTSIGAYVVMPNHVHFIIAVGAAHRGCPPPEAIPHSHKESTQLVDSHTDADWLQYSVFGRPDEGEMGDHSVNEDDGLKVGSHDGLPLLPDMVGWFKASSTNYYIKGVKEGRYPAFDRRLWQRNYYEHIIRTDSAYNNICEYIDTNPQRWEQDRLR